MTVGEGKTRRWLKPFLLGTAVSALVAFLSFPFFANRFHANKTSKEVERLTSQFLLLLSNNQSTNMTVWLKLTDRLLDHDDEMLEEDLISIRKYLEVSEPSLEYLIDSLRRVGGDPSELELMLTDVRETITKLPALPPPPPPDTSPNRRRRVVLPD